MITNYVYGPSKTEDCSVNSEVFRIYGRAFDRDECIVAGWPNSGFSFNFYGSNLVIETGEYTGVNEMYVKVTVDKTSYKFPIRMSCQRLIIDSLPLARHKVSVRRITEGEPPITFRSVTISGNDCRFMAPERKKSRRIEFVGDSITCGYGVLGQPTTPNFRTFEEDSTQTYAFFTAEAFGADIRTECLSGKGLYCNCMGDVNDVKAGEFFRRVSPFGEEYDFLGWTPKVLVINVGTNDMWGGAKAEQYMPKMKEFYAFAREKYPESDILILTGFMGEFFSQELREFVREQSLTDKKLHFSVIDGIYGKENETGANGHPNVNANVRVHRALVKKIASITGWKNKEE